MNSALLLLIADRAAKESKNYLSFYYLEAISYEILPEEK